MGGDVQQSRVGLQFTFSGNSPVAFSAAAALSFADTIPITLPRSSTKAPPEFPGCRGTLIWKKRGSPEALGNDQLEVMVLLKRELDFLFSL